MVIPAGGDSVTFVGRVRPRRQVVALLVLAGTFAAAFLFLAYRQALTFGDGRALGYSVGLAILWFLWASWISFGRESIVVRGRHVHSQMTVLGLPVHRSTYDLLQMKGLVNAATLRASRTPGPGDSGAAPRLRFWYGPRASSIGWALSPQDADELAAVLRQHDAELRLSLGLPSDEGLSDTRVWTPERIALIETGLEDTEADRRGRFLGP